MKSNFEITCTYCKCIIDFSGDHWHDELVDDTDSSFINCPICNEELEIITNAIYTLSVVSN